jgi:hypothetical protein
MPAVYRAMSWTMASSADHRLSGSSARRAAWVPPAAAIFIDLGDHGIDVREVVPGRGEQCHVQARHGSLDQRSGRGGVNLDALPLACSHRLWSPHAVLYPSRQACALKVSARAASLRTVVPFACKRPSSKHASPLPLLQASL